MGIENPPHSNDGAEPFNTPYSDSPNPGDPDSTGNSGSSNSSGDASIKGQINDLIADIRKLAEAEIEYYRIKLSVNLAATKTVLLLFSLAVITGITTIIALILGILLILSYYWGPVAATCLLTGGALLITTILMNMAITRARKLPLDENDQ